ncbi:short palate, lung and nasal epithelium carcinoma-associated protein 2A-like [Moschus berezovskii]|uniref:short palate, lung and nasal epithelium carcinoma-associated protein 2A-like n=1 Tax=Moschus berezovskii TaxID=68408 RepID=UPI0024445D36|nr:short palate, lung and nasal epithelium carcinoma-associated protein 2A-like [Moschus berezovskii]
MFQLWKLVLLCGLLAGTSASLLDSLGNDVLRKPKSGLERGLVNLDSTLKTVFQNLKTELESRCSEEVVVNQKTGSSQNLLEQLISRIFQAVNRFPGVRIRNVQVPDIKIEATSDNSADVKIPITANVTVNPPLLGESLDLDLKVDLQTSVSIETDPETGDSKVVVGICPNNPGSISLTVQHRRLGLLSDVVDNGVNFARQLVSSAVQHELCPRIRELLESLDILCVKKLIGEPQETQQKSEDGK